MNMDWILECFPDYKLLVEYDNIENKKDKQEIHGLKNRDNAMCMFCGNPFDHWEKKDVAHAISECVGNKRLINFCECYDCNHLFGEIAENHLGKFIMPYRIINEVYGKGNYKNVAKDMPENKDLLSYGTYRFEQKKNVPIFPSETFDVHNMLIEKRGTRRLTQTENGFQLSIPRQTYEPKLAYVSLLKMAYTLMPISELTHYKEGLLNLYLYMSMKPCYDEKGNEININLDENDRRKYIDSLPNKGIELCIPSKSVPKGVHVCLLKRFKQEKIEPKVLFAIQMKWHTIIIPVISDDCTTGENCKISVLPKHVNARILDFSKVEEEFICDMTADLIEIPKELYPILENDLRDSKLLKKIDE